MRGDLTLFRLFGIEVKLHFSWWFIFILLTWSLASSFFPLFYPNFTSFQYFVLGLSAAFLLFLSVLLHEFSHSLIAKSRNIKVESITLFFFGGVAGITDENIKPKDEFLMSIAGPLFSLVLAAVFFGLFILDGNVFLTAISFYLYQINLILAIFNLVPAFPLDGGRAFRSMLHAYYHDLKKATRIAAAGGKIFAWVLAVLGLFQILTGLFGGLWLIFLGIFLYFIAGFSYEQVIFREVLSKWKVKNLMQKNYPTAISSESLASFLEGNKNNLLDSYLVQKSKSSKEIIGVLNLKKVGAMPPAVQERIKVRQVTFPIEKVRFLKPNDTAYAAFKILATKDHSILPVRQDNIKSVKKSDVKGRKIVGIITRSTVVRALGNHLKFGLNFSKK